MHFDGGANYLTGESVSFGESRVHVIGLILEQKITKETEYSEGNRVAIEWDQGRANLMLSGDLRLNLSGREGVHLDIQLSTFDFKARAFGI